VRLKCIVARFFHVGVRLFSIVMVRNRVKIRSLFNICGYFDEIRVSWL
jgi:hypothetical protein